MVTRTVVLGWDALDHARAVGYGVADAFAPAHRELGTFENDVLGGPQTYELWPTAITGLPPREHGLRHFAAADTDAALARAAKRAFACVTDYTALPLELLVRAGTALQDRGVMLSGAGPDWYRERGLRTVFDGRDAWTLAVPNYRDARDAELDAALGYSTRRGRYLSSVYERGPGRVVYRPRVSPERVERWLAGDARERLRLVREHRDAELVFCWLPTLDVAGHLSPVVGAGVEERLYGVAASLTAALRRDLGEGTRLVVVSDHGHAGGMHTRRAFFGADRDADLAGVRDLADVYDFLVADGDGDDG